MSDTRWTRSEYRVEAWVLDSNDHDETPWFPTMEEAEAAAYKLGADPPFQRCAVFRREVSAAFPFKEIPVPPASPDNPEGGEPR